MALTPAQEFYKENKQLVDANWKQMGISFHASGNYLWGKAHKYFEESNKKGFFFVHWSNMEEVLQSTEHTGVWIDKLELVSADVRSVVEQCNPETSFVVVVTISVTPGSAMCRHFTIHKKDTPDTAPIPDMASTPSLVSMMFLDSLKRGCQLCSDEKTHIVCSVCNAARYCSKRCKRTDRHNHKENCRVFVESRKRK
jgi:hypothetical protein